MLRFWRAYRALFSGSVLRSPASWVPRSVSVSSWAVFFLLFFCAEAFSALDVSFRRFPNREQLELRLPPESPQPDVKRIAARDVHVLLPMSVSADNAAPFLSGSTLLDAVSLGREGLRVRTTTEAFGFVGQYDAAKGLLLISFFPDPLGSRWQQNAGPQRPEPSTASPARTPPPAGEPASRPAPAQPASVPERNQEQNRSQAQSRDQVPGPAVEQPVETDRLPPMQSPAAESSPPPLPAGLQTFAGLRRSITEPAPPVGAPEQIRAPIPAQNDSQQLSDPSGQSTPPPTQSMIRNPIRRVSPEDAQPVAPFREQPEPAISSEPQPAATSSPEAVDPQENAPVITSATDVSPAQAPIIRQRIDPGPSPTPAQPTPEITPAQPVFPEAPEPERPSEAVEHAAPALEDPASQPVQVEQDRVEKAHEEQRPEEIPQEKDPDQQYRGLMSTAKAALMNAEFDVAVEALRTLSNVHGLSDSMREEALYNLGDAMFGLHQNDLANNFVPVAQAYERAMHMNPKSIRTPLALRNLGVLHLRVDNLPEARAYFNVLRRDYPHDPLVPTTEYYLGQYFLDRGDYNQAADYFQRVVQNHPEYSISQQSSVGLARALNALGHDGQAFQIMDFLEKRWPRYYIDDPSLLELAGIIALRVNELESAKQRLLTYYNLVPDTPDADMLLARIGDIYLLTGRPDPARRIFEKAAREFPDQEGGLIAKMRLVEGGIHDEPSLEDMFTTRRAADVYSEIITKHPDSPLAAVATIKLAIWQIWNKRFEDSLMVISDFLADHPNHSLSPKALEVGEEAFTQLVHRNAEDGRYAETLEQWRDNPFLHALLEDFSPATRLGLAMAFWKTGDFEQAITLAGPYLTDATPRQVLIPALEMILGIYLEQQEWERIVGLGALRDDLPAPQKRELSYSMALALENLGRSDDAQPLWLKLAEDLNLGHAQRGYALYFLARKAMQNENFERVYLYAQESLSLLLVDREDQGKIRDNVLWLTQVTERTGRLQEALAWALELDQLIDQSDPEWTMSRYRLAQLYQRNHDLNQWQAVLKDLQANDPRGLYGRLAASALQGRTLEDSAGRFRP
ncbi:TolA-binding protein [Desulfonatronum thiosulfatophilum]|uniref:TolA-binding protein n=1 Tax=Desulfonatronum thiosulfatophilum TaxID=617002 RepID=A0A1G6C8W3_9BACT|nr:tetratricopeptide repeat protein [Desulfonatronum thiosulfatophilum]SDB29278.1 TolA-binding protein [Desulfonatronum thiosulfatophilum]